MRNEEFWKEITDNPEIFEPLLGKQLSFLDDKSVENTTKNRKVAKNCKKWPKRENFLAAKKR